jgi:hypothetical protein
MPLYLKYADRATSSKKETSELGQIQIQDDVYITYAQNSIHFTKLCGLMEIWCYPGSVPRDNLKVLFTILY